MSNEWLTIAQGVPGGIIILILIIALRGRHIRVGYEVQEQIDLYKKLWEKELAKNEDLEKVNEGLVEDLRESSETLNTAAKALAVTNGILQGGVERRRLPLEDGR